MKGDEVIEVIKANPDLLLLVNRWEGCQQVHKFIYVDASTVSDPVSNHPETVDESVRRE